MRLLAGIAYAASVVTLAACNAPYVRVTISDDDLAPYRQSGSSALSGDAMAHASDGSAVTCAGSEALLLPDLPPIRRVLESARSGSGIYVYEDPNWRTTMRRDYCDSQGRFNWVELPPRKWLVVVAPKWPENDKREEGVLFGAISTVDGTETHISLTDKDYTGP